MAQLLNRMTRIFSTTLLFFKRLFCKFNNFIITLHYMAYTKSLIKEKERHP